MKKIFSLGPRKNELREVEMPVIRSNHDVMVKLKYCGVCRSEHYDWENAKPGICFGHEPVGTVYAVGNEVTKVKVGDRVSGDFRGDAEYVVTNDDQVFALPDFITDEQGVLEPLACLISAVSKLRQPLYDDKVAVIGCGYMGCGAISLLKLRGARVIAVDVNRKSLENAKKYGADELYTPDEVPNEYLTPKGGRGINIVMEWAEVNESLDLAIDMTAMCGQLAVGAYHTGAKRSVNVEQLNVKAIDMLSTHPREWEISRTASKRVINLFEKKIWAYQHVPTKIWPISRFDDAHAELDKKYGIYMKSLVDWSGEEFEPYVVE